MELKMEKRKKNKKRLIISGIAVVILVWLVWGNVTVKLNLITVTDAGLPTAFNGYRIAQVSDLHNAVFGKDNRTLIDMLASQSPDIIVITGDMVDSSHTNVEVAVEFAQKAVDIAPCYYVTGNHEAWLGKDYAVLEAGLLEAGVTVLHDEAVTLERGGEAIQLIGMDDPTFRDSAGVPFSSKLQELKEKDAFTVLLSHRPERFELYVLSEADLVFSGHAHGGQVRIPYVGGLIAPDQGLFPKYDAGVYTEGATTMVVSRGVGNSIIPVRVNNRPEIVVVELRNDKEEVDESIND